MARRYDSSRRKRAAEETHDRIVKAALKLHWQGVTEFEPLAVAAGCSLPTVRKHFPNKEALFQSCTRVFGESLEFPDLEQLRQIEDFETRLGACLRELCRIHEAMYGYAWLSAHARKESPTLDREMNAYEGLADAVADIIAPPSQSAAVVRGLLDFLTYRALRRSGGLPARRIAEELTRMIRPLGPDATSS